MLTLSILMSSCATIFNKPYKVITVYATEPSKIIYNHDTIKTENNKAHLLVKRKKETLKFVASTDSLTNTIEVKLKNSFPRRIYKFSRHNKQILSV